MRGVKTTLISLLFAACAMMPGSQVEGPSPPATLLAARQGFKTQVHLETATGLAPKPPEGQLSLVHYPGPLGENVAYVTPEKQGTSEKQGTPKPAIIWISGGFEWNIGDWFWQPAPWEDDQSAAGLRHEGMVVMYPALRGSNGNPGQNECMLGEVDDIIAAAKWLASRSDVDPKRVYLAGHSTGGTLSMLVAESTDLFRAIVAFGPVADVRHYGPDACLGEDAPFREWQARAVWPYVDTIRTRTWIVEGVGKDEASNINSIQFLLEHVKTAPIKVALVPGLNHFSVLAPGIEVLREAILADTTTTSELSINAEQIRQRAARGRQ